MFLIFLILGFTLLYYGAEFLVRGASAIAIAKGVKKIVIGLTIVAMGTSLPEFVVSLMAAIDKVDDVSVGNIVGSNIANILLVLGLAALIRPIKVRKRIVIFEMPVLSFFTIIFITFCLDLRLNCLEGIVLLTLFIVYLGYILSNRKISSLLAPEAEIAEDRRTLWYNVALILLGLIGLIGGGRLTVRGAVELARLFHIPEVVIGLTVVAVGTSLPELFTSIIAIIKGEDEISIGNIIGSNLFNIALILGVVPLIYPLRINPSLVHFDNWLMLGATLLLGFFTIISYHDKNVMRIKRWMGGIMLAGYLFFILNLIYKFV